MKWKKFTLTTTTEAVDLVSSMFDDIGIEGIPAENGINYFHCSEPEDYEQIVRLLLADEIDKKKLLQEQRMLITNYFNLEESVEDYIQMIENIEK